jgi:hypothetical protein
MEENVLSHGLEVIQLQKDYRKCVSTAGVIDQAAMFAKDAFAGRNCDAGFGYMCTRPKFAVVCEKVRFSRIFKLLLVGLFIYALIAGEFANIAFIGVNFIGVVLEVFALENNPLEYLKRSSRHAFQIVSSFICIILASIKLQYASVFIPWTLLAFYNPTWKLLSTVHQTVSKVLHIILSILVIICFYALFGHFLWSDLPSVENYFDFSSIGSSLLTFFVLLTT